VSYSSASITKKREAVLRAGNVEVARDAADEEAGVEARGLEDPGEDRGDRALAVGPRDGEHPLVDEHVLREPLRPGRVRQPPVEDRLDHGLAARHRVSDDVEVRGIPVELLRVIALVERDAQVASWSLIGDRPARRSR
jgi:hypothetical protein